MNTTTTVLAVMAALATAIAIWMWTTRPKPPKRESFTVLYPSNEKLQQSWDPSGVLTRVLPGGTLR